MYLQLENNIIKISRNHLLTKSKQDLGGQHHMRTMKIREMINIQKRKAVIAMSSGMVVFAVSLVISTVYTVMFSVAFIGFAIAMGAITFLEFGLSCPQCQGRIGCAVNYPSMPLAVSSKIRFCPFCGVSLDSCLKR
jgi:hypothetical protein